VAGVLRAVRYISPGPWVLWRGLSGLGYNRNLRQIDDYLYPHHRQRRAESGRERDDLLSLLIHTPV
jgi:cytochrome P450